LKNESLAPALWMLGASLAFALMGVCVKLGSNYFSSGELVFYRGVVGVIFILVWARVANISLTTSVFKMHLLRSSLGVVSLSAWFYALAHLHLATAMTLNYMSSVWLAAVVVGSALWWKKSSATFSRSVQTAKDHHGLQAALVATVLMGFAGVLLVLRPAFESGQEFAGFVGLVSGIIAAFAYLQVSSLARAGEPEIRTVFYFALGTVLAGLVSMAFTGVSSWPSWESKGALWLLPIGVLASIGQICMTKAYGSGATLLAANLQYMGIVYSALFGLFIFGDAIAPAAWLGMALIIACGITASVLRAKMQKSSSTPEPAEEY
jgi:drug/metabolite transporter (DMT)-like permease